MPRAAGSFERGAGRMVRESGNRGPDPSLRSPGFARRVAREEGYLYKGQGRSVAQPG